VPLAVTHDSDDRHGRKIRRLASDYRSDEEGQ